MLSPVERKAVLEFVNDKLESLPLRLPDQDPLSVSPPPPAPKRRKVEFDEFDDVCESSEVSGIQKYQNYSVVPGSCKTILGWWKEHAQEFPQLAHIAKTILCIMATSAPSEKSFSVAGHVSERRSCLSGSSVSDVLLINSASK